MRWLTWGVHRKTEAECVSSSRQGCTGCHTAARSRVCSTTTLPRREAGTSHSHRTWLMLDSLLASHRPQLLHSCLSARSNQGVILAAQSCCLSSTLAFLVSALIGSCWHCCWPAACRSCSKAASLHAHIQLKDNLTGTGLVPDQGAALTRSTTMSLLASHLWHLLHTCLSACPHTCLRASGVLAHPTGSTSECWLLACLILRTHLVPRQPGYSCTTAHQLFRVQCSVQFCLSRASKFAASCPASLDHELDAARVVPCIAWQQRGQLARQVPLHAACL